jgi:hypothetical protein
MSQINDKLQRFKDLRQKLVITQTEQNEEIQLRQDLNAKYLLIKDEKNHNNILSPDELELKKYMTALLRYEHLRSIPFYGMSDSEHYEEEHLAKQLNILNP